jgi:hypothetical protein
MAVASHLRRNLPTCPTMELSPEEIVEEGLGFAKG